MSWSFSCARATALFPLLPSSVYITFAIPFNMSIRRRGSGIFLTTFSAQAFRTCHKHQACQKGRFWKKNTIRTSISSVHPWTTSEWPRRSAFIPRTRNYPQTGFYGFTPIKICLCGRTQVFGRPVTPSARTHPSVRADIVQLCRRTQASA
jgi:hypothetical protein